MPLKSYPSKVGWCILIAIPAWIIGSWGWRDAHTTVYLKPGGKAVLLRGGFFHRTKCDLSIVRRQWQWHDAIGGGELLVPIEGEFNKSHTLLLADQGRAYSVDKSNLTREELRIVNGEWSRDAGQAWVSVFDFSEPSENEE